MIKDIGLNYVILGHSERRNIYKESNEVSGNIHALIVTIVVFMKNFLYPSLSAYWEKGWTCSRGWIDHDRLCR